MRSKPRHAAGGDSNLLAHCLERLCQSGKLRHLLARMGIPVGLATPDRRVLEDMILPYFAQRKEFHTILFVGCDWYTKRYKDFFSHKDYWTLDIDPSKRRHGARNHIIGPMEEMKANFSQDQIDLVVCNGVFGWGLNKKEAVDAALTACERCLRPGGVLIVGWNDLPERKPFEFRECDALRTFSRTIFEPLGSSDFLTEGHFRHTFSFFSKAPVAAPS